MPLSFLRILPVLVLLAACAEPDPSSTAIALEPIQRFDPPPELHAAPIDLALAGGRLWTLDFQDARVHSFTLDGRHVGTYARPGRGPGELAEPFALGAYGDRIWVLNTGNARIDYFTLEGEPVGSQPVPDDGGPFLHMVRIGEHFYGASVTGRDAIVRFAVRPNGESSDPASIMRFGRELTDQAEEIFPGAIASQVLRLAAIGDRVWVVHTQLPLYAVYSADGELIHLARLPSTSVPDADPDVPPALTLARDPRGSTAAVPVRPGLVFLLTQMDDADGSPRIVVADEDGVVLGTATNTQPITPAIAVVDGDFVYGLALDPTTDEAEVYAFEFRDDQVLVP